MDAPLNLRNVDDALPHIGEFGVFQLRLQIILSLMKIPQSYQILVMYFTALNPPWKYTSDTHDGMLSNDTFASINKTRCYLKRDSWQYTTPIHYSVVTTYDLACGKEWMIHLCTSIFFVGWGIGSLLFGWISDKYGRKSLLLPTLMALLAISSLSAFSPNIETFITSRFLVGVLSAGTLITLVIIASEFVGSSHRPFTTLELFMMSSISYVLLAVQAMFVSDWRHLLLILTLPYIPLVLFWSWLPESARWLHAENRTEEAVTILKTIGKVNKKSLPDKIVLEPLTEDVHVQTTTIGGIFSNFRVTCLTGTLGFGWFAVTVVYYGMSLAASDFGGSDLYINFIFSSLVELPAYVVAAYSCKKCGRKPTVVYSIIFGGVFCACVSFVPQIDNWTYVRMTVAMIGKFLITGSFGVAYTWCSELYPTELRGIGLGFMQVMGRIGAASAPWIAVGLRSVSDRLPFVVMGCIGVLGGLSMLWLPETMNLTEDDIRQRVLTGKQQMILQDECNDGTHLQLL